ncbi:MAG: flagellar biosynthesis anti-sigma factor FlgM [Bdellovibrionota bacterium]
MEIRKLFGQQEALRTKNARQNEINGQSNDDGAKTAATTSGGPGQDVVSLSSLSKQLLQISNVLDDDAHKRAARVQELKQQVADGSYSVDSADVAKSIISYAGDVPPVGA